MLLANNGASLLVPVDKQLIMAGGKTVVEWKFNSSDGKSFASGTTVKIIRPWTVRTQWVAENVVVRICDEKDNYRFGFNGQEKVNEIAGIGNWIDYKERQYDPRLGRFISVDPLTAEFPWYTPYQFAGNTPIKFIDLDGLEPAIPTAVNPPPSPTISLVSAANDPRVRAEFQKARNEWAQVLDGEAKVEPKSWTAGIKLRLFPIKLEGSAGVVGAGVKMNGKEGELSGKFGFASGSAAFGGNEVEASGSIFNGKLIKEWDGSGIKAEGEFFTGDASGKRGAISADNSGAIGIGGKLGPFNLAGSVNFVHLGRAIKHTASGVVNWVRQGVNNIINGEEQKKPKGRIEFELQYNGSSPPILPK